VSASGELLLGLDGEDGGLAIDVRDLDRHTRGLVDGESAEHLRALLEGPATATQVTDWTTLSKRVRTALKAYVAVAAKALGDLSALIGKAERTGGVNTESATVHIADREVCDDQAFQQALLEGRGADRGLVCPFGGDGRVDVWLASRQCKVALVMLRGVEAG